MAVRKNDRVDRPLSREELRRKARELMSTSDDDNELLVDTSRGDPEAPYSCLAYGPAGVGKTIDVEKAVLGGTTTRERAQALRPDAPKAAPKVERAPVPPGSYKWGAIVLLTDGRRTTGPDPLEIANMAAKRGVRVFSVGFGKNGGGMAEMDGYSMYMAFDETTLKSIAGITQGEYFHAPSAEELVKVYDEIAARFELERQHTEVTSLAAALGALLLAAAGTLSVLWFGRVT